MTCAGTDLRCRMELAGGGTDRGCELHDQLCASMAVGGVGQLMDCGNDCSGVGPKWLPVLGVGSPLDCYC